AEEEEPTEPAEEEEPTEPEGFKEGEVEGPELVPGDRDVLIQLLLKAGMSEEEAARVVEQGEVEGNIQRIIMGSINVPDAKLELPEIPEESPLIGFNRILERLRNLEQNVFQLEFNLSALLTDLFGRMREHAIELRENISEHLASRLKMRLFKNFVAESYRDVINTEFDLAERRILSDWLGEISFAFNEYRDGIRVAGASLRGTVLESEEVVRAFIESLEKGNNSLRAEIRELSAVVDNKENELDIMRYQLETTRGLGDLDRELRVKEGEIEYLLEQVRTLESERRNLEGRIKTLEAEQEVGKRSEEMLTRQRETLTQQTARIEELEHRLADLRAERNQLSEIRQKAARLEALEGILHERDEELKELRKHLSKREGELSTTLGKYDAAKAELKATQEQIGELQNELKQIKDLQRKVAVLDPLQSTLEEKEAELKELRALNSAQESELTELKAKYETTQQEVESVTKQLNEKRTELKELRSQVERVIYADETIRVQRSELESQADLLTDLAGKFGALEAELTARKEEIQALKDENTELREKVSTIPKIKRELELVKEQVQAKKELVKREQDKRIELEREIDHLERAAEELIPGMTRRKLETIITEHATMEKTFRNFEQLSKTEPRLEILFLLLKQPPEAILTIDEITKTVGIVPALVRRYIGELEKLGIVKQEDEKVLLLD
ncbi:MAG: winged helix-turn-helix transcriptional regulator, partial [Candidatus Heimdallarchaeota archaeon]